MTSATTPNVSFIGDDILMKYQEVMFDAPLSRSPAPDVYPDIVSLYYCDFSVEGQRLLETPKNIETLIRLGHKIKDKIVIMLGTYDVIVDAYAHSYIVRDMYDLLKFLRARTAADIAVCTIPRFGEMSHTQKVTLEKFNDYVRHLPNSRSLGSSIKVLDMYEILCDDTMFESDGIQPSATGCRMMNELIYNFIESEML